MTQLVILVVIAAWLAVLIPPMLRSRVENRPNSSVTDFRRQLDKLQHTSAPRPGVRAMGRPLAPSGLGRSGRLARPERPVLRSGVSATQPAEERSVERRPVEFDDQRTFEQREPVRTGGGRQRSHGDPTNGSRRPAAAPAAPPMRQAQRPEPRRERREHTAPHGMGRPSVDLARRRRANVLFLLLAITASTLFLAATTSSTVMFYAFALSFLSLIGYVYLLAQLNQRGNVGYDTWLER